MLLGARQLLAASHWLIPISLVTLDRLTVYGAQRLAALAVLVLVSSWCAGFCRQ
ncbi:hypothetical protein BDR04DRAFT_1088538 [Suillus decipiens]|nr:hypothetical protein BDR04DRAFT_1088538 [Suillus decipiens]